MKFRNLVLTSAFVLAITASFAFKVKKQDSLAASIWDPIQTTQCDTYYLADDDCSIYNRGAQCTVRYNSTYTHVPAYYNDFPWCTYPLYHQF